MPIARKVPTVPNQTVSPIDLDRLRVVNGKVDPQSVMPSREYFRFYADLIAVLEEIKAAIP